MSMVMLERIEGSEAEGGAGMRQLAVSSPWSGTETRRVRVS